MNLVFLALVGCGDVTPGEMVLGDEVSAEILKGSTGFGRSLALFGEHVLVTEPLQFGEWKAEALTPLEMGEARVVGHNGDFFWAWMSDGDVVTVPDGEVIATAKSASGIDVCPDGEIVSVYGPGESIDCAVAGVLWSRCEGSACSILVDDGPVLDTVSPGGDLSWNGDVACWGDPSLSKEQAAGRVACSDGTEVIGMKGDHLGLTIAGGIGAGRYNRHIVPPRLRMVSIQGGATWLIDQAAENSRVSIDSDQGTVAVGVAKFRQGASGGRVFIVKEQ
ncbi:MAG: hypothetical protein CL930_12655 [Deltaproteobacteria bacterium]|nr:hypothetical protein [Deltaproteobacteria bacterium]